MSDTEDPPKRDRLEDQLKRLSRLLHERGTGTEDPLPAATLAKIRTGRSGTLFALGRLTESLTDANLAVDFYRGASAVELDEATFFQALCCRYAALHRLGHTDEIQELEAEFILRFRDEADPQMGVVVAWALASRARRLLVDPADFEQGVRMDTELIEVLQEAPAATAIEIAEICVRHGQALVGPAHPDLRSKLTVPVLAAISNGASAARAVQSRLPARLPQPLGGRGIPAGLRTQPSVAAVENLAARAREARRVEAAALSRLYAIEGTEANALAARGEFVGNYALILLGDIVTAFRGVDHQVERHDPDVAAFYDGVVDEQLDLSTTWGQLNSIGFLAQRARALAGDDPVAARTVYEDSLDTRLGPDRAWIVRLLARALRPSVPRSARRASAPR